MISAKAGALGSYSLKEGGCVFVVAVFAAGEFGFGGDEFAAEGFGEDGLGQLVHSSPGLFVAGFDGLGEGEEVVYPADDFVFFEVLKVL